jgi:hypothetical protein
MFLNNLLGIRPKTTAPFMGAVNEFNIDPVSLTIQIELKLSDWCQQPPLLA